MIDGNLAMANQFVDQNEHDFEPEVFVLRKYVPMAVYFKCKDRTGQTNTSSPQDSMKFDTKEQAIEFNHSSLYGEYEAVPFPF